MGEGAQANGDPTVAIGLHAVANGSNSVALGSNSKAYGVGSVAIGANSQALGVGSMAMGLNSVASGNNSVAIGSGSIANADNTVSMGSEGNERRITNVAPGVNPTDAATVGQVTNQINQLNSQVNNWANNTYSGIAMAGAFAAIPQVEKNDRFNVGAGIGNYVGKTALAVGFGARVNEHTQLRFGLSSATGGGNQHLMLNAGVGFSW
ncbi:hypothetical protein HY57_10205 [Dyella japonica A8]|uniref:Adhesin n=1 Tax=Dyella japonica A8 TaxID=1217721 RepID=A0A075K1E6_9GAMM|nr:hypothetical protein HY57_10205 [Dyella japonica A8]